jgi:hypothetical protein
MQMPVKNLVDQLSALATNNGDVDILGRSVRRP